MYCKLFASLYQGTLRGRSNEILVFTNLLAHATKEGDVDKHFRAIAEETGLTLDEVKAAIEVLESPDEESRSPEAQGARLQRIDEHRVWGWRIVNYAKYRAIRSEEDRAEQNRLAQARWREKHKQSNNSKPPSAMDKQDKPMQKQRHKAEVEVEAKETHTPIHPEPPAPPSLHLEALQLKQKLTPEQIEVAGLVGRRATTEWDDKELKAWSRIRRPIAIDDWKALRWYYRESGCTYLRRDLLTLLNNWNGEIDRAKNYDPHAR